MIYFGIFLESYRICSLRKGYSYYQNNDKLDAPAEDSKKVEKESKDKKEEDKEKEGVNIELVEK